MTSLTTYLNSLPEKTAYKTIQTHLDRQYAVAMLENYFGDPQQIISAYMEELLEVANCMGKRPTYVVPFILFLIRLWVTKVKDQRDILLRLSDALIV